MIPRRCCMCGCFMFSFNADICECCLDDMREEDADE